MGNRPSGRRDFLRQMTALGAVSLPGMAPLIGHRSADFPDVIAGGPAAKPNYDPTAKFEITVTEVDVRRTPAGRLLMARVYQPNGAGPFPTVLDLHGGAWNAKDRHAEEPMDRALAASGVARRRHRPDAGAGSAVSGVRAGRKLRRALAEVEGRVVERRPVEDRRLRQLERRPRRRAARDAPARSALQRDSASRGAEGRRDGGLRRDAVADQRSVRALPERGEDEARGHGQEPHDVLQAVGDDPRKQSAGDPRAPRDGRRSCRC